MPTVNPWTVALSLGLHGVLLLAAAREPVTLTRRVRVGVARLDAVIGVDLAGSNGGLPPEEAAPAGPARPPGRQRPAPRGQSALPTPGTCPVPPPPAPPPLRAQPFRLPSPLASADVSPALPPPAPVALSPPSGEPPEALGAVPPAPATRPSAQAAESEAKLGSSGANSPPVASGAGSAGGAGVGVVTSGPGTAQEATGEEPARLLASYLKGVRERVSRHREYPYLARRANLEGTVCLRVVVAASGRVVGVTPTCGTHQPLVEAALASVSSAAPFPPLPVALGQRLTIDVPVVFALDQR